jgi:hypothetical protein
MQDKVKSKDLPTFHNGLSCFPVTAKFGHEGCSTGLVWRIVSAIKYTARETPDTYPMGCDERCTMVWKILSLLDCLIALSYVVPISDNSFLSLTSFLASLLA